MPGHAANKAGWISVLEISKNKLVKHFKANASGIKQLSYNKRGNAIAAIFVDASPCIFYPDSKREKVIFLKCSTETATRYAHFIKGNELLLIENLKSEAIAIWTALKNWVSETENYFILTDSLSVLKSIQNINRKSNTIILKISSTLHQCLQIAQSITFIWVPAHKGIGINEEVDKLAKASPEPWNIISWITYEDLYIHISKNNTKSKGKKYGKRARDIKIICIFLIFKNGTDRQQKIEIQKF
ncbi:hypothetical protein TNCV_1294631 [Trichonephila clavipes]|nr:hypothetical protein TNCV_1294631 [Trichonephila clavipes]